MKNMIKQLKRTDKRVRELKIYGDENAVAEYIKNTVQGMLARMTTEDLVLTGYFIEEAINNRQRELQKQIGDIAKYKSR